MGDDESFQKWIVVRSDGHDVTIRFELPDELQRKLRDALEGAAW
jgi:hypothetical protein